MLTNNRYDTESNHLLSEKTLENNVELDSKQDYTIGNTLGILNIVTVIVAPSYSSTFNFITTIFHDTNFKRKKLT